MSKLRLILVDDHEIVRIGLKTMLSRHPDFDIVDEASTGQEAVRKALSHRPDIVIMDVRLSGMSGIEACKEITHEAPEVKIIMLTSYGDDDTLYESIAAGARGYVLKEVGSGDLVRQIMEVGLGGAVADPLTTKRLLARMKEMARKHKESAFSQLTEQELRVLALLSEGKTNREIADVMVLGEGTIRNYVSSIFSKLHVNNRAEAAAYAAAHNIRDYL